MHLSEFKAWFEGFTEDMDGPPSEKQWAKIKQRVKEITADYTPPPIFVDRYVYPYRRYWSDPFVTYCSSAGGTKFSSTTQGSISSASKEWSSYNTVGLADWSQAGRAEYKSLI